MTDEELLPVQPIYEERALALSIFLASKSRQIREGDRDILDIRVKQEQVSKTSKGELQITAFSDSIVISNQVKDGHGVVVVVHYVSSLSGRNS